MSEKGEKRKHSKSFYRKCAYGGKKPRLNSNILEPGIKGFLVMCNNNEKSAVREAYNILNEYADILYGHAKQKSSGHNATQSESDDSSSKEDSDEDEDVEKALKKEVEGITNVTPSEKRFQNVMTKAKNCVFIRTTIQDPMKMVAFFMDDIAQKKLRRARFAARILPIVGTCKADTSEIEKFASEVLSPVFSPSGEDVPKSYSIIFKSRNNNGTRCGREGVVSSLIKVIKDINSDVRFTWSDYSLAVLVEIVCTVCCIGVAPDYIRLRKYNLQELTKGAVTNDISKKESEEKDNEESCESKLGSEECGEKEKAAVTSVTQVDKTLEVEEEKKITEMTQTSMNESGSVYDNKSSVEVEETSDIPVVEKEDTNNVQIQIDLDKE